MRKPPKIPGAEIIATIRRRVANHDRAPFQEILADAVSVKPSLTAWRKMAKADPEKYTRALSNLTKIAGYTERSESLNVTMDARDLAQTLVARYGQDKAKAMLELHGLPASLLGVETASEPLESTIIDHDPDTTDAPNVAQPVSDSP